MAAVGFHWQQYSLDAAYWGRMAGWNPQSSRALSSWRDSKQCIGFELSRAGEYVRNYLRRVLAANIFQERGPTWLSSRLQGTA